MKAEASAFFEPGVFWKLIQQCCSGQGDAQKRQKLHRCEIVDIGHLIECDSLTKIGNGSDQHRKDHQGHGIEELFVELFERPP